jgi:hypothetical protein
VTTADPEARWPGRVAVGVLRGDVPEVLLADSVTVLGRVLALRLVARTPAKDIADATMLEEMRSALLEERWGDAVAAWMQYTGEIVDGYPDEPVWTNARLDADTASVEIRLSPIFDEQ